MQPVRETVASPDWAGSNHLRGSPWRCAPALRLTSLRIPAALASPGQTIRGLPARRNDGPPDLRLIPSRSCFAWVPARAIPARAFVGVTVHRTVTFIWLTLLRAKVQGARPCAPACSGDPGAAHSVLRLGTGPSLPWLGRSPGQAFSLRFPASLQSPGQTFRGLPARRGGDSLDHRQYAVSPTGPLAYLRLTRSTFVPSSPTRSHHLSQRYCRQRC